MLRAWRVGRNNFYAVEIDGMRDVLRFLTEDCCNGRPELCGTLVIDQPSCGDDGNEPCKRK